MKDFAWLDEIESDLKHFEHTNINWTEEAMPKLIETVKTMRKALENVCKETKDYQRDTHISLLSYPTQNGCKYYPYSIARDALEKCK